MSYDILVYNQEGELQTLLTRWNRLEYHQRINAPWNHQITLEAGINDPILTTVRSFEDDYIIQIYRRDIITGIKSLVYEGFHTTPVDQVTSAGTVIFNMYGVGYGDLLKRRVVVPPTNESHLTLSGNAEDVAKAFVSHCCSSPTDTDRKMPGFSVEGSSGAGEDVEYSARYTILLSVVETVCEQGNLDFNVIGGPNVGEFIFSAKSLWGKDRRIGNTDGNDVMIFDILHGNMAIPIYSQNSSEEKNYAYVGGSGVEEERIIREVADTTASTRGKWSRKEFFVEARQQNDVDALIAAGRRALEERKKKVTFNFNTRQTTSTRWIRDWNLGDLVTSRYFDYEADKQIIEVRGVVTAGSQTTELIEAELEDVRS